jgi:hypothetical protein
MKTWIIATIVLLLQVVRPENMHAKIFEKLMDKESTKELFKIFHSLNKKTYNLNSEEGIKRYRIFKKTLQEIREHNAKPNQSYQLGVTPLADMTAEEADPVELTNLKPVNFQLGERKYDISSTCDVNHVNGTMAMNPNFFDTSKASWYKDITAPNMMAAVEAAYFLKTGNRVTLSPQSLIDCLPTYTQSWTKYSHTYMNAGFFTTNDYPFIFPNSTGCKDPSTINGFNYQPETWESVPYEIYNSNQYTRTFEDTCSLLKRGPFLVNLSFKLPSSYKSGIYIPTNVTATCGSGSVSALVVGYESNASGDNWILRGYWGPKWGDKGYVRIPRNDDFNNWGITCAEFVRPVF